MDGCHRKFVQRLLCENHRVVSFFLHLARIRKTKKDMYDDVKREKSSRRQILVSRIFVFSPTHVSQTLRVSSSVQKKRVIIHLLHWEEYIGRYGVIIDKNSSCVTKLLLTEVYVNGIRNVLLKCINRNQESLSNVRGLHFIVGCLCK